MSPSSKSVTLNGADVTAVNFTATALPSTWSIFGTVTSGSGATITLSGAAAKTTTADAVGAYTFAGLANGAYTVSASKPGFSITPASQAVTINGASVSGVLFSALANTWTISGSITSGAGATVSLGGANSKTATADASGNYSFTGLANGSYTVAPWKTSMAYTPTARSVTVSGADQTAINFSGASQSGTTPTPDVTIWSDKSRLSSSLVSPAFSTQQGNELLLAYISTNNATTGVETVSGVSGGGLVWTLVKRSNTMGGTAEIWRAFAPQPLQQVTVTAMLSVQMRGMIAVMSFAGVDTTGTNGSGAIGASSAWIINSPASQIGVVTTRSQSLVVGVANDDWATARIPDPGNTILHQFVDYWAGTYWLQRWTDPVAVAGTRVILSTAYPRFTNLDFSAVEVRGPAVAAADAISAVPQSGRSAQTSGLTSRRAAQAELANPLTRELEAACTPGGWAALIGTGFTGQEPQRSTSIPLPMTLAGARVDINGEPAPMLFASPEQVNFQCPQLDPGSPLRVQITTESKGTWPAIETTMNKVAPAIFTLQGTDHAVVQIAATGQLVGDLDADGVARRAQEGEHVRIYATGLGETQVILAAGVAASADLPVRLKNRAMVVWNGEELEPLFAGLVPGTVGVFQLDLLVPRGSAGSDIPVTVRMELADGTSRFSQQTVVSVGAPPAPFTVPTHSLE